jgi:hypothetical protein
VARLAILILLACLLLSGILALLLNTSKLRVRPDRIFPQRDVEEPIDASFKNPEGVAVLHSLPYSLHNCEAGIPRRKDVLFLAPSDVLRPVL